MIRVTPNKPLSSYEMAPVIGFLYVLPLIFFLYGSLGFLRIPRINYSASMIALLVALYFSFLLLILKSSTFTFFFLINAPSTFLGFASILLNVIALRHLILRHIGRESQHVLQQSARYSISSIARPIAILLSIVPLILNINVILLSNRLYYRF